MGLASALHAPPMSLHCAPLLGAERFVLGLLHRRPAHLILRLHPHPHLHLPLPLLFTTTLTCARRRNRNTAITSPSPKKNNKKRLGRNEAMEEEGADEIDDDAIEALFAQLEEDLKNEDPSLFDGDDDEDISEEDLAKLDEELAQLFDMVHEDDDVDDEDEDEVEVQVEYEDEDEDEEEEEEPLKLRNWQLRRLASALKTGRRKTNIKSLAAELCLDRAVVLELLRQPPPSLLMMAATLPDDEPTGPIITVAETKTTETVVEKTPEVDTSAKVPVHVMQRRFSTQKRLKKLDIQTLEYVYRRTKRPTNTMIDSIVHVTNLPRKRIVKWFEEKRAEEGVPGQRLPYQRSVPDAVQ